MKKLTSLILSSALLLGTAACQNTAKTSADAPDNTGTSTTASSPDAAMTNTGASTTAGSPDAAGNTAMAPNASASPDAGAMQTTQKDSQSDVRRAQLNSDIRAREQRNNTNGGDAQRANGDLESEVRSKLEANIQKGLLAVQAKDGVVTVSGTVANQKDLSKIDPLAKEIKGVKSVVNKATVAQ